MDELFAERIFPVLTPLAVDPSHPFPYISGLSINLAVLVRNPDTGVRQFARVKVPSVLSRFIQLAEGRFVAAGGRHRPAPRTSCSAACRSSSTTCSG